MPRGDRTGPGGMGPMTGRGAGFCAGYERPGFTNPGYGGGYGRGGGYGGFGRGFRNRYYATGVPFRGMYGGVQYTAEQELELQRKEVEMMEAELKAAKDRIARLEKEAE